MQTIVLAAALAALAIGGTAPVIAASHGDAITIHGLSGAADVEKRRKPRVKGGSGCDDAGDAVEHPECR